MVGTTGRKCKCTNGDASWLGHWALAAGVALHSKKHVKCAAKYCRKYSEVGAHVKDTAYRVTPWIVPFCQYHNKRPATQLITLKPGYTMVACASIDCT
ncbi:MAG: hypothetical protein KUG77_25605 [Nannocystaceae bacterium]|nr:hypothetical protein [Nannocystaceae bacterium]